MKLWIARACQGVEALIAVLLAAMVVLVFGNVVLRYGFNSGITVSEEVSRWLFIWVTFLGALLALREHAHLGVDAFVGRLPSLGRKVCLGITHVAMLYIMWLLFQGSVAQAKINWDVAAPVTGFSMAVVYVAAIVFAVGAAFLLVLELVQLLAGKLADDQLVTVRESEDAGALAQVLAPEADCRKLERGA
ncbi:MAG TPA: TRAP transporter small permease [Ramlibacter sp.]|nr:TRAP transporter small permease [Ramlibacter sp.]